jgi:hypothetical protein
MAEHGAARPAANNQTSQEKSTATAEASDTSVGPASVPGQPRHVVRWVKGGTDWCLRCFAASGDLSDHPPCDPPTGLDVLSSKEGITTCTLDYGPDWEPLGLVGPGHRGFTRTELRVRFHGAWRCATCDRSGMPAGSDPSAPAAVKASRLGHRSRSTGSRRRRRDHGHMSSQPSVP